MKQGQRHQAPKGVSSLDEDTWQTMLADRRGDKGQLWKTFSGFNHVMPDVPGTVQQTFGFCDLPLRQACALATVQYASQESSYRVARRRWVFFVGRF